MNVKVSGNFKQTADFINQLNEKIDKAIDLSGKQIGLKGEQIAVKHIQSGDLGWAPLNERYLKFKLKNNKSEKILVSTTKYFDSITTIYENKRVFIGVKKGVKYDNGAELTEVAKTLEFGSVKRKIKERPLWSPTSNELLEWVKSSNLLENNIKKNI